MEFLKDLLGEELYAQVAEKLGNNDKVRIVNAADGSFVPKGKLDEERTTVKQYKAQVAELNEKLTALQSASTTVEALRGELNKLQADMAAKDTAMKQQALEYRVRDAIRGGKARNADLVMKMLDMGKITEDGDKLIGLTDQIDALKKSDSYLFEPDHPASGGVGTNQEPGGALGANYAINQAIRQAAGM